MCQAVKQAFNRVKEAQFSVEDYWIHSLAVAVCARILSFPLDQSERSAEEDREFSALELTDKAFYALEEAKLAPRFSLTAKDDPFAAGMMHDIGRVAMTVSYPGVFAAVLEELQASSWEVLMLRVEQECCWGGNTRLCGGILGPGVGIEQRADSGDGAASRSGGQ